MNFFKMNKNVEKRNTSNSNSDNVSLDVLLSRSETLYEYSTNKAITNSDIWTAVNIIASDIASTSIDLIENKKINTAHNAIRLLNVKPNKSSSAYNFWFVTIANMLLNGQSFVLVERDKEDKVVELKSIPKDKIQLQIDHTNNIIEYLYTDISGNTYLLKDRDILHFKFFSIDGLTGVSPLIALKYEMNINDKGKRTLKSFIENGNKATGILKIKATHIDKNAKKSIREKFEDSMQGDNYVSTIILDDTAEEYSPITIDTGILEYINQAAKATTNQIAKVYKIPLNRFGMELTNTSTAEEQLIYLQNTLSHYMNAILSEINSKLLDDVEQLTSKFVFNTERFMETTPEKQMEYLMKSVSSGIISINEARQKLNLPPVDDGDDVLVNMSYSPLSKLGEQQATTPTVPLP